MVSLRGGVLVENGNLVSSEEVDEFTWKFEHDQIIFNEIDKRHRVLLAEETGQTTPLSSQLDSASPSPF
jgi:hypothetical protein